MSAVGSSKLLDGDWAKSKAFDSKNEVTCEAMFSAIEAN